MFKIAILTGMRSAEAVTSSCAVIWKHPSPSIAQTVASGRPTLAPIAAGTAKPIVPAPPEFTQVLGCSNRQHCDAHIWCWPTPATTIVSSGVWSRRHSTTYWGFSTPSAARPVVGEREARLPVVDLSLPGRQILLRRCQRAAPAHCPAGCRALGDELASIASMTSRQSPTIGDVGAAHLAELGGVDVDVDHLGAGGEGADLPGHPVVEAATERDQQVGLLHRGDRGVVAVHAGHPESERVRVGERAAAIRVVTTGIPVSSTSCGSASEASRLQDAAAGVDDGPLGGEDQVDGLGDEGRVAVRPRGGSREGRVVDRLGPVPVHLRVRDVLRDVDEDGPGPAGRGDVERLGDDPRDVRRRR